MLKRLFLYSIIGLLFFSCTNKQAARQQEILALKEMNQLVTVEYVVNKIIKASDDQTWYKFGDRKILMTCEATLKAGIDFSKINATDISITDKEITLTLPHATLFSLNIKPEDIKVAYQEIGAFRNEFSSQERNMLAAQAQTQIQASADSLGVLQTAETNASLFVGNFLRNLGYEKVTVRFGETGAPAKLN
ncbi:MAG: DUF4230 domain-containing protein [Terrimonas sp.]|nr:DUF4230 domain-containing protein [Terrimonas sp.]